MNRVAAMCFFVARLLLVVIINETSLRHFQNLRPINRLIYCTHTQQIKISYSSEKHVLPQDPTVVWRLFSRESPWISA